MYRKLILFKHYISMSMSKYDNYYNITLCILVNYIIVLAYSNSCGTRTCVKKKSFIAIIFIT
jgi:hypothetical protein